MTGKTALVTGATSGLGLATAQALAARGATVILGARSVDSGERARAQVEGDTHVVAADLSSLAAVRAMADEVAERFDRLDVLVNNAGVDVGTRSVTADGLELTFAVNCLAPFVLTTRLRDLLVASRPARVLNVASSGYRGGRIDFDDLQSERRFSGQRAYNASKLALVLLTYELARRWEGTGVTVNAVDPGFVRGTSIGTTLPAAYKAIGLLLWPFMASVEKGVRTAVWAASDPALEQTSGRYFKGCREISTGGPTHDEALARRLWDVAEELAASTAAAGSGVEPAR